MTEETIKKCEETYALIKQGLSVKDAIKQTGNANSNFYTWRKKNKIDLNKYRKNPYKRAQQKQKSSSDFNVVEIPAEAKSKQENMILLIGNKSDILSILKEML